MNSTITTIFNGENFAQKRELLLKERLDQLQKNGQLRPGIGAIVFSDDVGSQVYTKLKAEAAARLGIDYQVKWFSLDQARQDPESVTNSIYEFNLNPKINGIIIQKPWRKTWINTFFSESDQLQLESGEAITQFNQWWLGLVSTLDPKKDVDGLHPSTLDSIKQGLVKEQGRVMPATARAVKLILLEAAAGERLNQLGKIIIIGRSDLLGKPLFYNLLNEKCDVEMIGKAELNERIEQKKYLQDAQVLVSATGIRNLIKGEMVSQNVVVVDGGEPGGDVEFESVQPKASFITPVPGGVGPVTVSCLMENCLDLVS